ncbi:MAG: lipopolysaccharide kinase InaA family protein [Planctomycetota bacterium]
MGASVSFVELRERRGVGWLHPDFVAGGLEPFWSPLQPLPQAKGRGGVGTAVIGGRSLVVRPYRRGGALGAILRDRYMRPGRARAELELLAALRDEGVPVVTPIAAVARRSGAFWRLRLCTELLDGALPLPAFLAAWPALRRFTAEAVGAVLRLAFAAGLRHPDLHADNILCQARGDRVRIVLVDLDHAARAKVLRPGTRDAMLVRMHRYWLRHRQQLPARASGPERMRCLRALEPDREARHELWRRLARKVARALRRRRLFGRSAYLGA